MHVTNVRSLFEKLEFMIIEKIQGLKQGTVIPKPKANSDFKIKGWGKRRGESALIYWIPNHKSPDKPLIKGITVTEFERAYAQLLASTQFTRQWFNTNLDACAKEGSCNFTTIGGIFQLLDVAHYVGPGTYILSRVIASSDSRYDLEVLFDQAVAEVLKEQESPGEKRSILDEVMESLDEEGKASLKEAIEELGKIFGST